MHACMCIVYILCTRIKEHITIVHYRKLTKGGRLTISINVWWQTTLLLDTQHKKMDTKRCW